MPDQCNICGETIVIRYINGRPTPIHVNGNWCNGSSASKGATKRNTLIRSYSAYGNYTDPNAYCPVCGEKVFYFETSAGSRVFFDDLGWPWPKHPCTDNPRAKTSKIITTEKLGLVSIIPKDRMGRAIDVYEVMEPILASCTMMTFWLVRQNAIKVPVAMKLRLFPSKKNSTKILSREISEAPALLTRRGDLKCGWKKFWFIRRASGRIVQMKSLVLAIRK